MDNFKFIVSLVFILGIIISIVLTLRKSKSLVKKGFSLSIIAVVVAFIPYIFTFIDYFPTRPLDIISVTPVFVYRDFTLLKGIKPTPKEIGCYLIVNVKNGRKDSYISSFQLTGKLKLRFEDYLPVQIFYSTTKPEDIEKNYRQRTPYYQVSWSTWPYKTISQLN